MEDAVLLDCDNLCADFAMFLSFVFCCLSGFRHCVAIKEHDLDILCIVFITSWNLIEEEALPLEACVNDIVLKFVESVLKFSLYKVRQIQGV